MEIKRSVEISIEKTRRFVIRQPETEATTLCPICGETMLPAETAAALFRVKCRRVYRIVESNAAHFTETETGAMFVCPPSLEAAINNLEAPSGEIANLLTNSTSENRTGEIEIKQKSL